MRIFSLRVFSAFLLALALTIMPMPELLSVIRPPWVLLLLLYLQYYMPEYFHLPAVFLLGLLMDVMLATIMGEHALALALTTWLASGKARRFCFFTIGQQMALIGMFCFLYQLIIITIDGFLGFTMALYSLPGTSLISILLWPWLRLLLEETLLFPVSQQ